MNEIVLLGLLVIVSLILLWSSYLDKKHRKVQEGEFEERLQVLERAMLPSISAAIGMNDDKCRDMFSAPVAPKDCSTRDAFSDN